MSKFHKLNARWGTIRDRHLRREPLCRHCAARIPPRATPATEVDHIVPLHKGGTDAESNLQSLCSDCHAVKTRRDLGQFVPTEFGADGLPTDPDDPWRRANGARGGGGG